jgi:hypothetical protein
MLKEEKKRDANHLRFIRLLPCAKGCFPCSGGSEAAHIRIGSGAGISQKPADNLAVPLCPSAHREQHNRGEKTFWGDVERARKLATDLYQVTGDWDKGAKLILDFRRGL